MGDKLAGGNVAIALLANTLATGAGLVALILTFGPISGGHFNPAVTLADATQGGLPWREVPVYRFSQVTGAFAGVAIAHVMFEKPLLFASMHDRSGVAQMVSEFVATFGLLAVISGASRRSRRGFLAAPAGSAGGTPAASMPAVPEARKRSALADASSRTEWPSLTKRSKRSICVGARVPPVATRRTFAISSDGNVNEGCRLWAK